MVCSHLISQDQKEKPNSTRKHIAMVTASLFTISLLFLVLFTVLPEASATKRSKAEKKNFKTISTLAPSPSPTSGPTSGPTSADAFNGNYFVGTQAIFGPKWNSYRIAPFAGHEYAEKDFDMLTEFRESVAVTGMNHFKFKLSFNNCASYHLNCTDADISSLTELSQVAEIAATFEDPRFKWYHIWGYSYSLPGRMNEPFTQDQVDQEYNEIYFWAAHMLETYKNTGKTFFLGNWEGDWELMWSSGCKTSAGYNFTCVPDQEIIDKYIIWTTTRQTAINDAKRDYGTDGVNVYFYIEFNLGDQNYEDHPSLPGVERPTMLNSVIPSVNPDFLSYSSYKSTNKYIKHQGQWFDQDGVDQKFWNVLEYAESKLMPKDDTDMSMVLGEPTSASLRRVFIGEFGTSRTSEPELWVSTTAQIIRAALEWGCPFVLQWEDYDNDSSVVPMVPRDNQNLYTSITPLRQFLKDWSDDAQAFVADNSPTTNELRLWAVEYFRSKY
jgi:hypothetical protein